MSGSSRAFLLRPTWVAFHVLVIVSITVMITLGLWQLRRLDERTTFNATVTERIDQPPVPLEDLLAGPDAATDIGLLEWRQVTVTGQYSTDQVVWFNRSQDGLAGDNVLSALVDGDNTVLVNRGFVLLGDDVPAAPSGAVELLGRVRLPPDRQRGELTDASQGPLAEVRRIDLQRLDEQLPGELAPIYLDLVGSIPNVSATDPIPVPPPTLSDGPHLSYAVQWFIFAAAVFVGWVLAVRRSIAAHDREREPESAHTDGRHSDVTDAADGRTVPDSPTSNDVASTTTTT